MTDITKHPLLAKCSEVMRAIEACGASEQLTGAILKAMELQHDIDAALQAAPRGEAQAGETPSDTFDDKLGELVAAAVNYACSDDDAFDKMTKLRAELCAELRAANERAEQKAAAHSDMAEMYRAEKERADEWQESAGDLSADVTRLSQELEDCRAQLAAQQAWVKWNGDYEKQAYDVALTPWDIVLGCWPNAGKMCAVDGTGREWTPEQVYAIRVCAHQGEPAAIAAALQAGGEGQEAQHDD